MEIGRKSEEFLNVLSRTLYANFMVGTSKLNMTGSCSLLIYTLVSDY